MPPCRHDAQRHYRQRLRGLLRPGVGALLLGAAAVGTSAPAVRCRPDGGLAHRAPGHHQATSVPLQLPLLRALRGGRKNRVRIGKNRWINPKNIARPPAVETGSDPDDGLNLTLVPAWTEEGQKMLRFGRGGAHDVDDHGHPIAEHFIYQTPRRIVNYTAFLEQETPRIANHRLWQAAEIGEDDEIRLVAAYLDADVNSSNPVAFSLTALHYAALHGHASTVALLESMGADVNACDAFDSRPLHYAADAGHGKVVELLLQLGAHAFAENMFGRTALHWVLDPLRWPGYRGSNVAGLVQPSIKGEGGEGRDVRGGGCCAEGIGLGRWEDGVRERERRGDDVVTAGRRQCIQVLQRVMGLTLVCDFLVSG